MSERSGKRFFGTGASSVLMIFVVLCLTTFGILSLLSARADLRLSRKTEETTTAYYAADVRTEQLLQQADNCLLDVRSNAAGQDENAYMELAGAALSKLEYFTGQTDKIFTFSVPVGDHQSIRIELEVLPFSAPLRYQVISRYVQTEMPEDEESRINVWPGFNMV